MSLLVPDPGSGGRPRVARDRASGERRRGCNAEGPRARQHRRTAEGGHGEAHATYDVEMSDEEWRAKLEPDRYEVLRRAATEPAWSGLAPQSTATARSPAAGAARSCSPRARSSTRAAAGPASTRRSRAPSSSTTDKSLFMRRTEISARAAAGTSGHVFDDGPTETGQRYCVNSLSIDFDRRPRRRARRRGSAGPRTRSRARRSPRR